MSDPSLPGVVAANNNNNDQVDDDDHNTVAALAAPLAEPPPPMMVIAPATAAVLEVGTLHRFRAYELVDAPRPRYLLVRQAPGTTWWPCRTLTAVDAVLPLPAVAADAAAPNRQLVCVRLLGYPSRTLHWAAPRELRALFASRDLAVAYVKEHVRIKSQPGWMRAWEAATGEDTQLVEARAKAQSDSVRHWFNAGRPSKGRVKRAAVPAIVDALEAGLKVAVVHRGYLTAEDGALPAKEPSVYAQTAAIVSAPDHVLPPRASRSKPRSSAAAAAVSKVPPTPKMAKRCPDCHTFSAAGVIFLCMGCGTPHHAACLIKKADDAHAKADAAQPAAPSSPARSGKARPRAKRSKRRNGAYGGGDDDDDDDDDDVDDKILDDDDDDGDGRPRLTRRFGDTPDLDELDADRADAQLDRPPLDWYCLKCRTPKIDYSVASQRPKVLQPGIVGLLNVANTCYINAALQSLHALPEFAVRLLLALSPQARANLAAAAAAADANLSRRGRSSTTRDAVGRRQVESDAFRALELKARREAIDADLTEPATEPVEANEADASTAPIVVPNAEPAAEPVEPIAAKLSAEPPAIMSLDVLLADPIVLPLADPIVVPVEPAPDVAPVAAESVIEAPPEPVAEPMLEDNDVTVPAIVDAAADVPPVSESPPGLAGPLPAAVQVLGDGESAEPVDIDDAPPPPPPLPPSPPRAIVPAAARAPRQQRFLDAFIGALCSMSSPQGRSAAFEDLVQLKKTSGAALAGKYYSDAHQDMYEYMVQALDAMHELTGLTADDNYTPERAQAARAVADSVLAQFAQTGVPPPLPADCAFSARMLAYCASAPTFEVPAGTLYTMPMVNPEVFADDRVQQRHRDAWERTATGNRSVVAGVFDGMCTRTRTCPSGHTSYSDEPFRALSLHFPDENSKKFLHLGHMIAELNRPELLEVRCEHCDDKQTNQEFRSITTISHYPDVLVLHLARFRSMGADDDWDANKIKRDVRYPLNMRIVDVQTAAAAEQLHRAVADALDRKANGEIDELVDDCDDKRVSAVYDLAAVVNHLGTFNAGHYFSFVRNPNNTAAGVNEWYKFDDASVTKITDKQVQSANAYVLIYRKRAPALPRGVSMSLQSEPSLAANAGDEDEPASSPPPVSPTNLNVIMSSF